MLVKFNISLAGPDVSYHPGPVYDLDDSLAQKWIEVGHCSPAEPDKTQEQPKETAVSKRVQSRTKAVKK